MDVKERDQRETAHSYFELVYLVTALVPSDTACLANSPGRRRRTAVWISREVMVDLEIRDHTTACMRKSRIYLLL